MSVYILALEMTQTGSLFLDIGDVSKHSYSPVLTTKQARSKTLYEIYASMDFVMRTMSKIKFNEAANHRIIRPTRTEKIDAGGAR